MDYVSLRKEVIEAGLLERQYGYYAWKLASTFGLLAVSIFFLAKVDNFALQLLNAVLLAFVTAQFGGLMHDAAHGQIFTASWKNRATGLVVGNLFTHVSTDIWKEVHNRHHSAPNDEEVDPDTHVPGIAYTEDQTLEKKGLLRFMARYQAFYWLPLMSFAAFLIRVNHHRLSLVGLVRSSRGQFAPNLLNYSAIVAGAALYFGLIFHFLPFWKALIFAVANYLLTGIYMGTIFATNHKAMPMNTKQDFMRAQVLTTRNVKPNALITLWCSGLNYQIEHHLFPTMPRNNFGKAQKIIRPYCQKMGIGYYETGFFRSYGEILQHLHKVGSALRKPRPGLALASFTTKA